MAVESARPAIDAASLVRAWEAAVPGHLSRETALSGPEIESLLVLAARCLTSDDPKASKANEKAKTATLEVTPAQAEKVALLTELGKLSMSLRSLAAASPEFAALPENASNLTWDRDVSRVLRSGRLSSRLLVLRGSDAQDVSVQEGTEK